MRSGELSRFVLAMKAALVSPYFLYRIEWQSDPGDPQKVTELSDIALASRLRSVDTNAGGNAQ